ncbi:MAG: ribonuclease III [Anaerovoracaceae bacterium]|jgi:ribonuclease-3
MKAQQRKQELQKFERRIGYTFRDPALLDQALTHSSYTRECSLPRTACNERLEFLGDAFFDAIIGERLYELLPTNKEGSLTKYRALVVCEESLAEVGRRLGVGALLLLGHGEEQSGGRDRESIVADATEAIIGALYLDAGYNRTRDLVQRQFAARIDDALAGRVYSDYKSALQERVQRGGPADIRYRLLEENGPDHNKTFRVAVLIDEIPCGQGFGHSKKEAEQKAAMEAIAALPATEGE